MQQATGTIGVGRCISTVGMRVAHRNESWRESRVSMTRRLAYSSTVAHLDTSLRSDTFSGSSGFLPLTPTVGNRMPEMFHAIGLSESSNEKLARSSASTTSADRANV